MNHDWREIALARVAPEFFVPDVDDAVQFYTDRLGFHVWRIQREVERAVFAVLTFERAVVMFAHDILYAGGPPSGARGVGVSTRLMVGDVDAVYRRCQENGITVVHDIADRGYGLRDFTIEDLNGFRLRFASPLR